VSVTHLGFRSAGVAAQREPSSDFRVRVLGADAPYLLYVGRPEVNYKNFRGLLDAYAASASLRANFSFLFAGDFFLFVWRGDFTGAERAAISKAGVKGRVRFLGVPMRCWLPANAHASLFVCPFLFYEGFGIPVLEAMSLDCLGSLQQLELITRGGRRRSCVIRSGGSRCDPQCVGIGFGFASQQ